jgi:hypothetical protein
MKKIKRIALLVFMSIIMFSTVKAGPGYDDDDEDGAFTNGPGGGGDPGDDPDIPLDPGSWILAAAGVGYGVKKWRDAKRKGHKDNATATTFFLEDDIHKK